MIKLTFLASVFTSLLLAAEVRDAKAVAIANDMMTAMGGEAAWHGARFVRFDFKVAAGGTVAMERRHLWDKQTGRYRIDGKTKDGRASVTLFNAATKQGKAYVDGKEIVGGDAAAAVTDAYGAFINDMYWLAMPWKWLEPGVNLKSLGRKTASGKAYDVVELTFGQVGLTPGDRYRAFVSPKSKLMERWEYTLESGRTGEWTWEYAKTGGVMLASNHKAPDGKSISMGAVAVSAVADETVFSDPAKPLR